MTEPGILDRCGLSESATPRWTLAEDVEGYARHGFRAIGVWLHKLERPRFDGFFIPEATIPSDVVSSAADAIRSSGLEVSHLVLTGFYTEPELPDRIAHTLHATDVAASLGAGCVVVAPGRRNGRSYGETRDLAARALTEVFERATTRGVRLAVEPIISWQSDYMNTLGEALELVELVDHPSLGVFPDTFHLWRTGTLLDDIERAGARIFGVHLNDAVDGDDHFNRLPGRARSRSSTSCGRSRRPAIAGRTTTSSCSTPRWYRPIPVPSTRTSSSAGAPGRWQPCSARLCLARPRNRWRPRALTSGVSTTKLLESEHQF